MEDFEERFKGGPILFGVSEEREERFPPPNLIKYLDNKVGGPQVRKQRVMLYRVVLERAWVIKWAGLSMEVV